VLKVINYCKKRSAVQLKKNEKYGLAISFGVFTGYLKAKYLYPDFPWDELKKICRPVSYKKEKLRKNYCEA
jgi:hypothetical protein